MDSSPLDCRLCQKELLLPVVLECSHIFCKTCIGGRNACPVCDAVVPADFAFAIDPLTTFLLETSHEEAETCANCEKISQPMFFCETCQQSLCATCKTQTHEARMFARHRVVPLEERARVRGRVACETHAQQPYVLYCTETRKLVCIECFNTRPTNAGHSFIAIEQAHRAQLDKLESWASRLQSFQEERRDETAIRERLIAEINESSLQMRNNVWSMCQQIVDTVIGVREKLGKLIEEERKRKEDECREGMRACARGLNSASFCLLATHILCSSASVIDFLQLNGELIKRIQYQVNLPLPPPPPPSSSDITPRTEFARSLESLLGVNRMVGRGRGVANDDSPYKRRSGSPVRMLGRYQMMVDLSGAFGGLLARVDQPLKELANEVARLTRAAQERQRDMTLRRTLLKREDIQGVIDELESTRLRLCQLSAQQEQLRPEMHEIWQEELDRVNRQQTIVRRKVEEASTLEERTEMALEVTKRLLSYVDGIHRMTGILDSKRLHPPDPAPMESICLQINTISPDSNQRVQAIQKEELLRQASMEARKREEEEETKAKTVASLKHTKKKREQRRSRLVDTCRERSPGGTDVALLSPFHRHTMSLTSEESESETIGMDDAFIVEKNEREDSQVVVTEDKASISLRVGLRKASTMSDQSSKSEDVVSRRHSVLSSLNRAIVDYRGEGDANLKASEVKKAERLRANTVDASSDEWPRPRSAPVVTVPSETTVSTHSLPSPSSLTPSLTSPSVPPPPSSPSLATVSPPGISVVPAVPFVPIEVFKTERQLGAFEVREKVLESLKGRVSLIQGEEEQEKTDTVSRL